MLQVVQELFNLFCREVCANLWIVQDGFLKATSRGMGSHRGLVDERMGTLLAYPLCQCQHHCFREYKTSCCFQVGSHAVCMDFKITCHCAQQRQQFASR